MDTSNTQSSSYPVASAGLPSQPVFETASATNQNSEAVSHSAAPYIVVIATLVVLSMLSWGIASCSSNVAFELMHEDLDTLMTENYDEWGLEEEFSHEDLFAPLLQDDEQNITTRSFLDAINERPDIWAINQASIIPSTGHRITHTYSHSQQAVISFADSVLDIDEKYTAEMQTHLHNAMASQNDKLIADELAIAIKAAQAATDELNNVVVPNIEAIQGSQAENVHGACTSARNNALRRWSSIEYVLECALNPSSVSLSDLRYIDGWILDSSEDALENLREALSQAMNA